MTDTAGYSVNTRAQGTESRTSNAGAFVVLERVKVNTIVMF